jgi:hypothetical protein
MTGRKHLGRKGKIDIQTVNIYKTLRIVITFYSTCAILKRKNFAPKGLNGMTNK